MSDKIYEMVTEQIEGALTKALDGSGIVPWRKPWRCTGDGIQRNFNSNRQYRGINQILLGMSTYSSPFWLTFKGAKKAGGTVKKGERSTIVVLWKRIKVKDEDAEGGFKIIPILRFYRVFNIEQCEGITIPAGEDEDADETTIEPIEAAEAIWAGYEGKPTLDHGGDRAFYSPPADHIQLPLREQFEEADGYYSTLFHEAVHSTGHKDRLARDDLAKFNRFGDANYSREELTAEMGAAFLCAEAGISNERKIEDSAAYIRGWLKALKDDRKMVVLAGARAQKAADHILGRTFEEPKED